MASGDVAVVLFCHQLLPRKLSATDSYVQPLSRLWTLQLILSHLELCSFWNSEGSMTTQYITLLSIEMAVFPIIFGRGYRRPANTDRYVQRLGGVKETSVILNHLESDLFRRSDYLRQHSSYPHVYRLRWVWFVYYPWHVPPKTGRQKETSPATRSYLTFWKLLHILVTHCFSICCGMRIYRFFPGEKPRKVWVL